MLAGEPDRSMNLARVLATIPAACEALIFAAAIARSASDQSLASTWRIAASVAAVAAADSAAISTSRPSVA